MPSTLRIGFTGHRSLSRADEIRSALVQLFSSFLDDPGTETLILISMLAEGSDRLAAAALTDLTNAALQVVLPMPADQYCEDFADDDSKTEFRRWLSRATLTKTMESGATRSESYQTAGRHIVDQCDVLVTVWDGQPARGQGGTAEIVAYGRANGKPVYWIDSRDPGAPIRVLDN